MKSLIIRLDVAAKFTEPTSAASLGSSGIRCIGVDLRCQFSTSGDPEKEFIFLIRFGDLVWKGGKLYMIACATFDITPNKKSISKTVFLDVVEIKMSAPNKQPKQWRLVTPKNTATPIMKTFELFEVDAITHMVTPPPPLFFCSIPPHSGPGRSPCHLQGGHSVPCDASSVPALPRTVCHV
jgi:hypothetical protein